MLLCNCAPTFTKEINFNYVLQYTYMNSVHLYSINSRPKLLVYVCFYKPTTKLYSINKKSISEKKLPVFPKIS